MEFFLAPRQGGTLFTLYTGYIYMERKREIQYAVYQRDRKGLLYRVCGGGRIEAKFPWNAKSIYPLCVLLLPAFDRPSPFKALCVSFYWTNSGSTNKKGIPFHLSPISRPLLPCNYLKPVFEDTLLSFNFFVREIFVKRVCFVSLDERDKMIRQEGTRCRHASIVLFS